MKDMSFEVVRESLMHVVGRSAEITGATKSDNEFSIGTLIESYGVNVPSECHFWTSDVYSGKARCVTVNLRIPHVLPGFVKLVEREVYRLESVKLDEVANVVSAAEGFGDQLNDDEKAACNTLSARLDSIRSAYEKASKGVDTSTIPPIATAFACMLSNSKFELYPSAIRDPFDAVKKEIDRINRDFVPQSDNDKPSLKVLRESLDAMTSAIWTESAYTEAFTFRTNAALTYDVFRASYNGRRLDSKNGKVVRKFAQPKTIMQEVVYACLHCLQMKQAALADNAEKERAEFEKFWGYAPEEVAPVEPKKKSKKSDK